MRQITHQQEMVGGVADVVWSWPLGIELFDADAAALDEITDAVVRAKRSASVS